MRHTFSKENLGKLIASSSGDNDILKMIYDSLQSFESYHQAVFKMETWRMMFSGKNIPTADYREKYAELDKERTNCHNALLAQVKILNRIAEKSGLPALYNDTVSEEKPYRREVADAIFKFVNDVISNRV